ncbi:chromodomain-helicase-DNA-binding protein [Thraustotheca clavata]|uniref:Chromodomain-helicase-DNA-binding protein n=1 Tax=Thraustotheca clavata TaxID=74557 RepID=A0A1V9ZWX9_9STRA|nr:chromodomain-helicase-DNA-binding protein [Thraustotheca clavata]
MSMSGRQRNEAQLELHELQMDLKEHGNEGTKSSERGGGRGRRKNTKYNMSYDVLDDDLYVEDDEMTSKANRAAAMAKEMNTIQKEFCLDVILGRRVNSKTGSIEYLCKFVGLSHLHMRWLTYEEVETFFPEGYIQRNKVQVYDKKCAKEGYADTDEVDDLDIGNATVETILNHQTGVSNEGVDKKIDERRVSIRFPRKYPRVTDVYLIQNHATVMDRCGGILRRLMADNGADVFKQPVDTDAIPEYLDVIDNPMDLGTIQNRFARENYYVGPVAYALFVSDIRLVFTNCITFNADGSEISNFAHDLLKEFEKLFYEWVICPSAWQLLPSTGDLEEDAEILKQFHGELNDSRALNSWTPWEPSCSVCKSNEDSDALLMCDRCDNEIHLECLDPPLEGLPDGEWFCPYCEVRMQYEAMVLPKSDEAAAENDTTLANTTIPQVLSHAVELDTKFTLDTDTRTPESRNQSTRLFGNNTMFLVQWRGLSIRCSTWERAQDIGDDAQIVRYFKANKVPTEKEILQTTCQLPCCAKYNAVVSSTPAIKSSNCTKDRFCTLGVDHDGPCSREWSPDANMSEYGTAEYKLVKQMEQIKAQLFAFHCLLHYHAPDHSVLKKCGAATMAYVMKKEHFETTKNAKEDDGDYSDDDGNESESSSEDEDEDERLPIQMPAYSQLFQSQVEDEESENEDDDEGSWKRHQSTEDIISEVMAGMVEHIALGYPVMLEAPKPKYKRPRQQIQDPLSLSLFNMDTFGLGQRYTEYFVAVPKAEGGLGMRLGLADDGCARVIGFQRLPNGAMGAAEATGVITPGDVLVGINNKPTARLAFKDVVEMIAMSRNYVLFTFHTLRPAVIFPLPCAPKTIERRYLPLPPIQDEEDNGLDEITVPPSEYAPFSYRIVVPPVKVANPLIQAKSKDKMENYAAPNGPLQHVLAGIMKGNLDPHEHFASFLPTKRKTLQHMPAAPTEFIPYEQSPTFKGGRTLRSYQVDGLNWMISCWKAKRSSLLADEMGLGKTVQVVSFVEHLRTEEDLRGPFLIVVPLSTLQHWRREIEDWTDMNVCVYHDVGERGNKFSGKDLRALIRSQTWYYPNMPTTKSVFKFNILLTTFETILADFEEFETIHWRLLVVDEAHRLKSAGSRVLKQMRALHVDRKLLLTGTPLQNNTQELWVLLNFLEPVIFDSMETFNAKYGRLQSQEQVHELQKILAPYLLRRVKEDVEKSIPPKEETIIQVELTTLQKQYYRAIYERNRSFLYLGSKNSLPTLNNIQLQLRKCCNHPFLIKGVEERELEALGVNPSIADIMNTTVQASGKFVLVSKLLPKLKAEGHKVLIFSQFIRQLDLLERYCEHEGFNFERLDGSTYGSARQASIDRFSKKNSKSFVFLLSTKAGGVGINLIAADTVIIFDSDWNPQNDLQAQSRCHRIGQKKSVKIYRLVTRNTYESQMFDRASRKLGLEHAVLGTGTFSEAHQIEQPSAEMLVELLKKGAYGLLDDDDSASKSFVERDIETILKENATTRIVKATQDEENETSSKDGESAEEDKQKKKSGLVFDRSSFFAEGSTAELTVNDPHFWEKVLSQGQISIEMLSLKLEDGSALTSRQTKAQFMANLELAMERIVAETSSNDKDAFNKRSNSHEYDVAIAVLEKIITNKDAFASDQRKVAEAYMDTLVKSRVRSCRVNNSVISSAGTTTRRKTLAKTKEATLKRKIATGPVVELPAGDICALCGDGGLILLCDGPCHRSFHMECVGLKEEPTDVKWLCPDCTAGKHMCMCCGKVGKMGSENGVSQCSMAKCGRFYHTACVLQHPKVEWVGKKRFRCPSHICHGCTSNTLKKKKLPVVSCAHCAQAFHEKCMRGMRILRLSTSMMICSEHLPEDRGTIVEGDSDDESAEDDEDDDEDDVPIGRPKRNAKKEVEVVIVDDDDKPLKKQKRANAKAAPSNSKRKRLQKEDEDEEEEYNSSEDEVIDLEEAPKRPKRRPNKKQLI